MTLNRPYFCAQLHTTNVTRGACGLGGHLAQGICFYFVEHYIRFDMAVRGVNFNVHFQSRPSILTIPQNSVYPL